MVTGEKRCLQQSASYPLQFGLAIAALISPHGVPPATPERVQTSIGDRLWYHDMVFISSFIIRYIEYRCGYSKVISPNEC